MSQLKAAYCSDRLLKYTCRYQCTQVYKFQIIHAQLSLFIILAFTQKQFCKRNHNYRHEYRLQI